MPSRLRHDVAARKNFGKIKKRACFFFTDVVIYISCLTRTVKQKKYPGVAKFGIALEWGSRGRWFESSHSDQNVLMKDAAPKTPHESAVFLHI